MSESNKIIPIRKSLWGQIISILRDQSESAKHKREQVRQDKMLDIQAQIARLNDELFLLRFGPNDDIVNNDEDPNAS